MTIVEALKKLVLAFGGTASTGKTVVDVLKDVNTAIGGTTDAKTASEAIDAVAESVEDNVVVPEGKKTITSTAEVDVKAYATAQVVDSNLSAENIKKDVPILGITGEYEGSSGITYASVALTLTPPQGVEILEISCRYIMTVDGAVFMTDGEDVTGSTASVPMYGGAGGLHSIYGFDANSSYAMDENVAPVCTGGVLWDSESHSFAVTGNGTITATLTSETPK